MGLMVEFRQLPCRYFVYCVYRDHHINHRRATPPYQMHAGWCTVNRTHFFFLSSGGQWGVVFSLEREASGISGTDISHSSRHPTPDPHISKVIFPYH